MAMFRGILKGRNKDISKNPDTPSHYHPEGMRRITYFFENPDCIHSSAFCDTSETLCSSTSPDIHSESSSEFSSMATCTDNPGPGRTLDTHVFQPLGRLVEKAVARCKPKIHVEEESADESDCNSESSSDFSTMATRTNNPGPGRVIDTHFYQPFGRYIERILTNIEQKYFRTPQWNADYIMKHLDFPVFDYEEVGLDYYSIACWGTCYAQNIDYISAGTTRTLSEWFHKDFLPFKNALFQSKSTTLAFRRLMVQSR